jgi:excisionase family DNA binding protein
MNRKDSRRRSQSQQSSSQPEREQASAQDHGNGTSENGDRLLFVSEGRVLLTAEEVAEILRVPRSWIYSHLDQLPTVRLGRYVRFKRSEIALFLDPQKAC